MAYKKNIIFSALSFLLTSCAEPNEYQQQLLKEYPPSAPTSSSAKKDQIDTQAFSNYLRCKENKKQAELQGSFVSIAALLGAFAAHGAAGTYNPEQSSELKLDCQFPSS